MKFTSIVSPTDHDTAFMREAIQLSLEGMAAGCGGPFGAVIVRGETTVGRGWNQVISSRDPTAHAEVVAIRQACQRLETHRLDDCEIYASCEPCPMCWAAIHWARLRKVYYACTRGDAAGAGFDDALLYDEISRPAGARMLPSEQLLREEALRAFHQWALKPDRVLY